MLTLITSKANITHSESVPPSYGNVCFHCSFKSRSLKVLTILPAMSGRGSQGKGSSWDWRGQSLSSSTQIAPLQGAGRDTQQHPHWPGRLLYSLIIKESDILSWMREEDYPQARRQGSPHLKTLRSSSRDWDLLRTSTLTQLKSLSKDGQPKLVRGHLCHQTRKANSTKRELRSTRLKARTGHQSLTVILEMLTLISALSSSENSKGLELNVRLSVQECFCMKQSYGKS